MRQAGIVPCLNDTPPVVKPGQGRERERQPAYKPWCTPRLLIFMTIKTTGLQSASSGRGLQRGHVTNIRSFFYLYILSDETVLNGITRHAVPRLSQKLEQELSTSINGRGHTFTKQKLSQKWQYSVWHACTVRR